MKPHDIEVAFKKFEVEHVQVVDVLQSSHLVLERARIATTAAATRLPTVYGYREHVEIGGLISYGANLDSGFHRAATYVYKVLKGIPVTDLTVEFPTRLELVINLKTAKALGLDIPARLLARADEVIEYSIATAHVVAAVHESGCGTKRRCPTGRGISVREDEADIRQLDRDVRVWHFRT